MIIYPKTSDSLQGFDVLKPYVEYSHGTEIQMLKWEKLEYLDEIIDKMISEVPTIEEITVHPPLTEEYNFEVLSYKNFDEEINRIKLLIELSEKYSIRVNLLYHTRWDYNCWMSSGGVNRMTQLVELIENTNIKILVENIYSMVDKEDSTVLKLARKIDSENFKVCLDICHLHCQANVFKLGFDEFLSNYLNKDDCEKYVYQIHFASTLKNDGYVEKATHGRKHDTMESFEEDYKILRDYGMENRIIVPEISEDDYSIRVDQIAEIKMLKRMC